MRGPYACRTHGNPSPVMTQQEAAKARALTDFLFPKDGEWVWYISPNGYKFIKIKTNPANEQAA